MTIILYGDEAPHGVRIVEIRHATLFVEAPLEGVAAVGAGGVDDVVNACGIVLAGCAGAVLVGRHDVVPHSWVYALDGLQEHFVGLGDERGGCIDIGLNEWVCQGSALHLIKHFLQHVLGLLGGLAELVAHLSVGEQCLGIEDGLIECQGIYVEVFDGLYVSAELVDIGLCGDALCHHWFALVCCGYHAVNGVFHAGHVVVLRMLLVETHAIDLQLAEAEEGMGEAAGAVLVGLEHSEAYVAVALAKVDNGGVLIAYAFP